MDDWDKLKSELLEDPPTMEAFERRRPAYELASKLIQLRMRTGLTQLALAKRANMTQPEIARLESGTIQPTWETVARVLGAFGAELDIRFRDSAGHAGRLSIVPRPSLVSPVRPRRPM
jgi:transcriptional regulator with XRE-family HTH domain